MTAEQTQLVYIRGVIASLPAEDQEKIRKTAAELRKFIVDHPDTGGAAFAIVGAEMAADEQMGEVA
jgi:methyl coenzyme M reductase subunit C-like uncharacterized protein (methanogenesis marker protein 7)